MARGTATSIRLPAQLMDQLEHASASLHRGKNWIIIRALEEYLGNLSKQNLMVEAKRQSILASREDKKTDTWEDTDTSRWI